MTEEEIKNTVNVLSDMVSFLYKQKSNAEQIANNMEIEIDEVATEINKIQNKCSHKYKGKPTMMGKGNCIICGASDY